MDQKLMLDPSWNIHLTFRLPDDLLAFIHKKYQPFHRYEGQQKIETFSIYLISKETFADFQNNFECFQTLCLQV